MLAKNSLTDHAIDKPSKVEVPRPISSNKTNDLSVALFQKVYCSLPLYNLAFEIKNLQWRKNINLKKDSDICGRGVMNE